MDHIPGEHDNSGGEGTGLGAGVDLLLHRIRGEHDCGGAGTGLGASVGW